MCNGMEHGPRLSPSGCWDRLKLPSAETAQTLVSHHISFILTENSCQWLFSLNEQGGMGGSGTCQFLLFTGFFFNAGFAHPDIAANEGN